ncbi:MAG: hypothetical protein NTU90_09065 [Proteobacteria bacterium]|nr:hypothetical protein [Pseudomonadota bacterium]
MISHNTTHASLPVRSFAVSEKKDNFEVFAEVHELGSDCLVILWGGTKPHIGAVGIAQVRPSLRDPEKVAATSSVFTFVGHKEDVVAKTMSEELTRRLARNTVVVAGIHWDTLSEENIKNITAICHRLMEQVVEKLSLSPA